MRMDQSHLRAAREQEEVGGWWAKPDTGVARAAHPTVATSLQEENQASGAALGNLLLTHGGHQTSRSSSSGKGLDCITSDSHAYVHHPKKKTREKSHNVQLCSRAFKSIFNMYDLISDTQGQDISGFFYFTESNRTSQLLPVWLAAHPCRHPCIPSSQSLGSQENHRLTHSLRKVRAGPLVFGSPELPLSCELSRTKVALNSADGVHSHITSSVTRTLTGALIPEAAELGVQNVSILRGSPSQEIMFASLQFR